MSETKEVTIEVIEEESKNVQDMLVENAQKALRVGIGVVGLSQDRLSNVQGEFNEFLNKALERGEVVEGDSRQFVNGLFERRKEQVNTVTNRATNELDGRIETVLTRMNLPTKADIDTLTKKINSLTRKVDQLKKELANQDK